MGKHKTNPFHVDMNNKDNVPRMKEVAPTFFTHDLEKKEQHKKRIKENRDAHSKAKGNNTWLRFRKKIKNNILKERL